MGNIEEISTQKEKDKPMSKTALITGASSGIGEELARIHAQAGDNLVIVARSADKLSALKQELEQAHNIKVTTITKDLGQPNAPKEFLLELADYDKIKQCRCHFRG